MSRAKLADGRCEAGWNRGTGVVSCNELLARSHCRWCTLRPCALWLATHRPSQWSIFAESGLFEDGEAMSLIQPEIATFAGLEITGSGFSIGPRESLANDCRTDALALQFRIDADEHEVPVGLRDTSLVDLVHGFVGGHEPSKRPKP